MAEQVLKGTPGVSSSSVCTGEWSTKQHLQVRSQGREGSLGSPVQRLVRGGTSWGWWQVRGCSSDGHPALAEPSEQLAHLDLVPFISLSGTRQSKKDWASVERDAASQVRGGEEVGKGPCSHHIHKELTGVSHGHAEGLSAGGQFRGHRGQVTAWRGSRGSHGRGRWGHHQHGGAVERGHARGAIARVRVMAAQAAGQ